jgi:hypothetical protein
MQAIANNVETHCGAVRSDMGICRGLPAVVCSRDEAVSSIARKGMQEGKEELLILQLERRLGKIASDIVAQLNNMPSDQLNQLGLDMFDFTSVADLEAWIARH